MNVCALGACRVQKYVPGTLGQESGQVRDSVWVMGAEPGSSVRATSALAR